MTPGDPAQSQPPAARRPVPLDRFHRVRGASGIIAARRREQGRDSDLISAHQQNEKLSHSGALRQPPRYSCHGPVQLIERSSVRCRQRAYHQIHTLDSGCRKNLCSHQLAQPPLQLVTVRRRFSVLGNHQAQSGKTQRGGGGADVEMLRPPSPPRLSYALKLCSCSDPLASRITGPLTLQRTSKAV